MGEGEGIPGENLNVWASSPPIEKRNLGNGSWEVVFLTSMPNESYEKPILRATVPETEKSCHCPLRRKREEQGWFLGNQIENCTPQASVPLRGTTYDTQLHIRLSLRNHTCVVLSALHSNTMKSL